MCVVVTALLAWFAIDRSSRASDLVHLFLFVVADHETVRHDVVGVSRFSPDSV